MAVRFGPAGNSESFYAQGFKSTLQAPAWLKKLGLDAYEYQGGNGITASEKTLKAVGDAAAENGIRMSLHTPYFISLSSEFEEKREKSVGYIKRCADACKALGAGIMVVHTGSAAKTTGWGHSRILQETDPVRKQSSVLALFSGNDSRL